MEITKRKRYTIRASQLSQRGTSLVEMMIACIVLLVGVLAAASLIPLAIGTNSRNRQQSSSTVISQMIMEKILSVPPGAPTPTLSDCINPPTTINASGSPAGSGAALLSTGDVDFSQTAPAGYSMLYTACGTNGQQSTYDVRWNIQTPSPYAELVTVSAKLRGATNFAVFSLPVTIRSMIGQGN